MDKEILFQSNLLKAFYFPDFQVILLCNCFIMQTESNPLPILHKSQHSVLGNLSKAGQKDRQETITFAHK